MNALFCALDRNEFNRVSTCETAYDIWHTLEITYEGTSRVKESKINMYVHDYELFKMKPNELIVDMYTRFNGIVNKLKALGKTYENQELVRKLLRSLPKSWEAKVTAIQEAKDLNVLPLEELLGSLMTYEMNAKRYEEEDPKGKKSIAFQAEETSTASDTDESNGSEEDDVAMITRKFRKFLKKKRNFQKFERKDRKRFFKKEETKGGDSTKKDIICYECKKLDT